MTNDKNDGWRAFHHALVVTAVCASGMVACGTPDSSESDPSTVTPPSEPASNQAAARPGVTPLGDVTVLARVEIDPSAHHVLEFYETVPGDVVVIESMATSHALTSSKISRPGDSPLELFARARPGQAPPPELEAAVARSQAMVPAKRPVAEESGPHSGGGQPAEFTPSNVQISGDIGRIQQASSSSSPAHFINTHGAANIDQTESTSRVTFQDVRVQWSGDYWCQLWSDQSRLDLDHYAGNGVTVRRGVNGTVSDFSQAVGTSTSIISNAQGFANRRWDVFNASGDSMHLKCLFLNY